MDPRIKIRHISAFVEITRRGSLKQAAEVIHLTQPAISKTLKELEDILDTRLLDRDRAGIRLTPAGEVFQQFAEMSLGALQQGISGVDQIRKGGGGRILVGALPSVAARVLPHAAQSFAELAPDTVLEFEDGPHGYLTDRLRTGALDVLVGRLGVPETMTGLSFTQLYSEQVVFAVRPDHPAITVDLPGDLAQWPVIYPGPRSAIRPLVDRLMFALGVGELPRRIETVSGAFGRERALSTDDIWIISEGVVAMDIARGRLAKVPMDTSLTAGPVGVMTRADEEMPPAVRLFRLALNAAVDTLGLH